MKAYNKLVRDRIPEIIKQNGEVPKYRILDNEEYQIELKKKLLEEVNEYLESGDVEELIDINDVLEALVWNCGVKYMTFLRLSQKKRDERGHFAEKIFLESTSKEEL